MLYCYKNLDGIDSQCKYKLLKTLVDKPQLLSEIVDLFFCLLASTTKNCFTFSPSFLEKNVFSVRKMNSPRFASKAVAKAAQLSQEEKMALVSAEYIFLPFVDPKTENWNLITFCSPKAANLIDGRKTNLPCLHIYSGGNDVSAITKRLMLR